MENLQIFIRENMNEVLYIKITIDDDTVIYSYIPDTMKKYVIDHLYLRIPLDSIEQYIIDYLYYLKLLNNGTNSVYVALFVLYLLNVNIKPR